MLLLDKFDENKLNLIQDVNFLWYFNTKRYDSINSISKKLIILENQELINTFNDKNSWDGCFGVSSIITWNFLNEIQDKFNLFKLLNHIKKRLDRMDLERIFSLCCYTILKKNNFYFSDIKKMPYNWKINSNNLDDKIIISEWQKKSECIKILVR
jgi:hypothetical protein